ncbi:hypothetical protein [Sphingobacterium bovistauri]|uniref:Uncharacterized protein n=1 Tax=Sphingobacterium bovistauri TaxID=2781959 RepID=A0ABS7Z4V3_9SPHI|nr:hypothetical protein [Sphingobacterium bovistauri]MCA5005220.1 hypothetical protein [Sphingobacterium bovistauri]
MMQRIDSILFINPENPKEQAIFNFRTWCMLIEGIMVKYANKAPEEASKILENSNLYKCLLEDIRNKDYEGLFFYQHELEYHWAMLLTYGELYWHKGISSIEPEGFDNWESRYIKEHNLAALSFINLELE